MKVVVLYVYIAGPSEPQNPVDFHSVHKRFVDSYKQFYPKIEHVLIPVIYRGEKDDTSKRMFDGLNVKYAYYPSAFNGFDIGAYIHVGSTLDCDFVVGCNSQIHFYREGWLERLVEAHQKYPNAILGPWGSYERTPHLRGPCMAFPPWLIRRYPYHIDSRSDCYKAECGEWNLSQWAINRGSGAWMVTWNEILEMKDWRKPYNCFRRGDQSACIMKERHMLVYESASLQDKLNLSSSADGMFNQPITLANRQVIA